MIDKISRDVRRFVMTSKDDLYIQEKDIDVISRNYLFFNELLKRHSLNTTADLVTHLYLLLCFLTKSSSSTIYASLKSRFDDKTIKKLLKISDGNTIKTLHRKISSCAKNDLFCEQINEVR